MLSSPSPFYKALDAPSSSCAPSMADSTNGSKHLLRHLHYLQSDQISSEIESHVTVYFDVQMYSHALTMLLDILTSGISHSTITSKTACLPIPKYLRIASTLLVHPSSTTRVKNENLVEVASRSITLLRSVLAEVGPRNANLEKAFFFESGSRYTRRSSRDSGSNSEDDDDIKGPVSQNGLWRCAKDFWQIVGWSFNCSVRYPKRWRYWKVLLEYLLDVLDADWYERKALDDAAFNAKVDQNQGPAELSPGNELVQDSLLVQYLGGSGNSLNGTAVRRIVKAAFADGSVQSLKAYPEIFENETKDIRKPVAQKRKWDDSKNVKEISDDYDDEEEEDLASDTSEDSDESSQRPSKKGIPTYSSTIGDSDSIRLRQRVITLLSRLSVFLPLKFMPVGDVYGLFAEFTAALPIASFSLLLNISRTSPFPSEVLVSLIQRLCRTYLPKSAPDPSDFEDSTNDLLNQEILESCFLPWCPMTSSVEDNAKYSILVEYLFRLFLTGCEASHTPNLDDAVERGIRAREKKCKTDGRRKASAIKKEEEVAKIFLDASSRRLRSLVDWVQECSPQQGY